MPHEEPRDVEAHGNMRNDNEAVVDEQAEDVEAHARVMGNDNETVVDEQADDVEGHGLGRQDNETVTEDQASASADDQT